MLRSQCSPAYELTTADLRAKNALRPDWLIVRSGKFINRIFLFEPTDQLRLSFRRTHIAKSFSFTGRSFDGNHCRAFGFHSPIVNPRIWHNIVRRNSNSTAKTLPGSEQQSALNRYCEGMAAATLADKRAACQEERRCSPRGFLWKHRFSRFATGGSRNDE